MSKRIISAVMIVALVVSLAAVGLVFSGCDGNKKTAEQKFAREQGTTLSIGVLADVHVMSETQAVDETCTDFKALEARGQKMLGLSESILKTAVDEIIEKSKFDVVLVSGDNSDDGGEVTHRAVAAELQRLEDAGIKVFTIPGNHDINNKSCTFAGGVSAYTNPTTEVEFAEIYKNFGYNSGDVVEFYKNSGKGVAANDATFKTGDNLSYVADLDDNTRLIAIDMCKYVADGCVTDEDGNPVTYDGSNVIPTVSGRHDGAMTKELLLWVKAKIEEAVRDGKEPVGMMHFPLVQHFGALVTAENSVVNNPDGYYVADVLADAGMKYIFTGHIHIQDDALYTSAKGNVIYDINSASLCNHPMPVRYLNLTADKAYVHTYTVSKIKAEYLPSYLSAEEKAQVTTDLAPYAVDYLDGSMLAKVQNKVDMDLLFKLLEKFGVKRDTQKVTKLVGGEEKEVTEVLNTEKTRKVTELAEAINSDVLLKFLNMPLYKKGTKGLSVEEICNKYGVKLPKTSYKNVFNLAMSLVASAYGGDEKASITDSKLTVLKYSLYSAFYVIADFDLFGKLHALNADVTAVDLMPSMEDLFKEGVLDVCDNGLLVGVLSSLEIKALKKYLPGITKTSDNYKTLDTVFKLAGSLKDQLFGLDMSQYITVSTKQKVGFIDLGAFLTDNLCSELTVGLVNDTLPTAEPFAFANGTVDTAVPDNDFVVYRNNLAYSKIK